MFGITPISYEVVIDFGINFAAANMYIAIVLASHHLPYHAY